MSTLRRTLGVIATVAACLTAAPAIATNDSGEGTRTEIVGGLEAALSSLPSPDSARTASAADFDLAAALECIPVYTEFYCPQRGWSSEPHEPITNADLAAAAARTGPAPDGEATQIEFLAQVAALPAEEQVAILREDLNAAIEATGKVLADEALLANEPLPQEILDAFPAARDYLEETSFDTTPDLTTATETRTAGRTRVDPVYSKVLISSTSAGKQINTYYCGPASLAFMSWHDPEVRGDVSHDQHTWASWIGTTPSSGSSIWAMTREINERNIIHQNATANWRQTISY